MQTRSIRLFSSLCLLFLLLHVTADPPAELKDRFDDISLFQDGLAAARVKGSRVWGVIDRSGAIVVDFNYDFAFPFDIGIVKGFGFGTGTDENPGEFHILANGKVIQIPLYTWFQTWLAADGILPVRIGYGEGLADYRGNLIIPADYYRISAFSEGLAVVAAGRLFGYIDRRTGATAIKRQFYSASDFHGGLAAVKVSPTYEAGAWGYINKNGEMAIPAQFALAGNFADGLAPVLVEQGKKWADRRWGFIDTKGRLVIQPRFNEVVEFSEGLAAVHLPGDDNRWGFIDKGGRMVIPAIYQANIFSKFSYGLVPVGCNGKTVLLDRAGGQLCLTLPDRAWVYIIDNNTFLISVFVYDCGNENAISLNWRTNRQGGFLGWSCAEITYTGK